MDIARQILRKIEDAPYTGGPVDIEVADCSEEVFQYHLLLLSEAGLIDVLDATSFDGPAFLPTRLTWNGHEFLDASRNDTLWEKAKSVVLKKAGGLSFDVLLFVLKELAKQAVLDQ